MIASSKVRSDRDSGMSLPRERLRRRALVAMADGAISGLRPRLVG